MDQDDLAQTILDLEKGRVELLEDLQLSYQLAHHVKPLIDRMSSDELTGEFDSKALGAQAEPTYSQDRPSRPRRAIKKMIQLDGSTPDLETLSVEDKARWIFMERFISLEQHENILRLKFTENERETSLQELNQLLELLFSLPHVAKHLTAADLPALQKTFASTVILFRHPTIDVEGQRPCNLENLRLAHPDYFYKRRKTPNWYEAQDFYTAPIDTPHWTLCDFDFLNCTILRPERQLLSYARQWSLPTPYMRQKSVLEDIYDRVISGEALQEHLFEQNCNACTSTIYRHRNRGPSRMVYIVQKDQKIAIHGKNGRPHWKAGKRLWPGVYPSFIAKKSLLAEEEIL
jgi:hypothetical protein